MTRHCLRGLLLLAGLSLVPLSAQNRIDAIVARAVEQLGTEDGAAAAETLERLGAAAVPRLRPLLAWQQRGALEPSKIAALLYVLGRIGKPAAVAMPELIDMLGSESGTTLRQVVWALGEIGPFAAQGVREEALEQLHRRRNLVTDGFLVEVVAMRLWIGDRPEPERLLQLWRSGSDAYRVVVAECLRSGIADRWPQRAELTALLRAAIDTWPLPTEQPWRVAPVRNPMRLPAVVLAWEHLSGESLDAAAAYGLLPHFEPFQRRRALVRLRELPGVDRHLQAATLALLWDGDPQVRQEVLTTLRQLGGQALFALPVLRHLGAAHPDGATAAACASLAEELGGRDDQRAAIARALLDPDAVVAPIAPAASAAIVGELALGAELCPDDSAARLLAAAEARGALGLPATAAALRLFANRNEATRVAAMCFLERRGADLRGIYPEIVTDLAIQRHRLSPTTSPIAIVEFQAWIAVDPRDSDADVVAALGHSSGRVVLQALVELARRGPAAARQGIAWIERSGGRHELSTAVCLVAAEEPPIDLGVRLPQVAGAVPLLRWIAGQEVADAEEQRELADLLAKLHGLEPAAARRRLAEPPDQATTGPLLEALVRSARIRLLGQDAPPAPRRD